MRNLIRAVLLIGVALAGCANAPTAAQSDHVGTYHLVRVNGEPLPWVLEQRNDDKIEIVAAELVLNGNGTYSNSVVWRITEGDFGWNEDETSEGTYTRAGEVLTFRSGGESHTALFSGDTVTFSDALVVTVYRKVPGS